MMSAGTITMQGGALRTPHRFSVSDYHRMAEIGVLSEDDRVELIDGEVVEMSPSGSRHQACINVLNREFATRLGDSAIVLVQGPVRLDESNEPEPDVAILRPRSERYFESHPGPKDLLLVVEVAELSILIDRRIKLPLYARFGIPEVWIVDLGGRALEVHRNCNAGRYCSSQIVGPDDRMAPSTFPDAQVLVGDFLGPVSSGRS